MLKLKTKANVLIKYFVDGLSIREINRRTSISRKTISKYVKEFKNYLDQLNTKEKEEDIIALIEKMVEKPKYDTSNRKKIKLTDEIKNEIDKCIEKNKLKKSRRQHKQIMKKIDIYEFLVSKGYDIGYTTVCNFIKREYENSAKEAYIKQTYKPGKSLQFDYGDVKLIINGQLKRINMALFTTSYGSYHYANLYENKKMTSFLDGHVCAFKHFEGIHNEIVYDNLKQAVKKYVGTSEKEPTEDLLKISMYYGFNYRFCNAYRGNEKGTVERGIEYVRRKVFSKKDEFDTLEEANKYLHSELKILNNRKKKRFEGKSPYEKLQEEKPFLKPLIPDYEVAQTKELRVNKYSFITIEQNKYSVPDHLVGKFVFVKIYAKIIKVYHNDKLMCEHKRLFGVHEASINIYHYVSTLKRKPGALKHSLAFEKMAPDLKEIYHFYYDNSTIKTKKFIELLELISDYSYEKVKAAIVKLSANKREMVTTENVKLLVQRKEPSDRKQNNQIQKHSLNLLKQWDVLFDLKNNQEVN